MLKVERIDSAKQNQLKSGLPMLQLILSITRP